MFLPIISEPVLYIKNTDMKKNCFDASSGFLLWMTSNTQYHLDGLCITYAHRYPPHAHIGAHMSLKGKKVVFTGTMSKTRTEMKKEAKAAGIDVDGAVSSNTDLLDSTPG